MPAAKVALRPLVGLMTPRQFGPTMRMPPRRASANTRASSSAPAGPVSRKPAEMISAAGNARVGALPDDLRHRRGRRHDDRQIDRPGNVADGRVGLEAEHGVAPWVDGMDGTAERRGDEIGQHRPPDAPGRLGRADDGDRARLEERIERVPTSSEDVVRETGVHLHGATCSGAAGSSA